MTDNKDSVVNDECLDNNQTLLEIKSLLNRANKNMSDYKLKYQKQLTSSNIRDNVDITESVTVSRLKNFLSKYDLDSQVFIYDEISMQEKSLSLDTDNSKILFNKSHKSVTIKELTELLNKLEWNNYINIDNKYTLSTDVESKSNKVLLSLKSLKNE